MCETHLKFLPEAVVFTRKMMTYLQLSTAYSKRIKTYNYPKNLLHFQLHIGCSHNNWSNLLYEPYSSLKMVVNHFPATNWQNLCKTNVSMCKILQYCYELLQNIATVNGLSVCVCQREKKEKQRNLPYKLCQKDWRIIVIIHVLDADPCQG